MVSTRVSVPILRIDTTELVTRLGDVPDDNNLILRLIDGKRSLNEVIDACEFGDLECPSCRAEAPAAT